MYHYCCRYLTPGTAPSGVPWHGVRPSVSWRAPKRRTTRRGRWASTGAAQVEVRSTMEKADGPIQNGDLMEFEGDLMGFDCDLMGFNDI